MAKVVPPEIGQTIIFARGLTQKTPLRTTYSDVNLDIPRGCVCAVVAEDRKGKTELLLTLAGRMRPSTGVLTVAGMDMPKNMAAVRRISGMGFIDGVNDVQKLLTLKEVASAELNLHGKPSGSRATCDFLQTWGFGEKVANKTESLDRFDYVWFGIVLGIAADPAILVVDDIEADLTLAQGEQIMGRLAEIAHNLGTTVVVACTDYQLGRCADLVVPISDAAREQIAQAKGADTNA